MAKRLSVSSMDEWLPEADCHGLTHLFFPGPTESTRARDRREAIAKSICASCSVVEQCLEFAIANNEYGIWGGLNEDERRSVKRRQTRLRKQEQQADIPVSADEPL